MTSITRMNKKRNDARQSRIDLVESRRAPVKSPVMAAIEYSKKKVSSSPTKERQEKKEESKQNGQQTRYVKDLHSEMLMKNISSEMNRVKNALSEFTSIVEERAANAELETKSGESSGLLKGGEFSFSRKKQQVSLDKPTLDIIRKVIREEIDASGKIGGGGIDLPIDMIGKIPKKAGTPPTVPSGTKPVPTVPTGIPAQPRPAYDKAGRLGSIFSRTMETKGLGEAVKKTAKLAIPSSAALGGLGKAVIPGSLLAIGITAWDANDQLIQVNELEKNGSISAEQAAAARKDIKVSATGTAIGSVAGGALGAAVGSVAGPVGTLVGGTAGSIAGGYAGEKVAKYLNKESSPEQKIKNNSTQEKSKPVSSDVKSAIDSVSKEFNIPKDEMLAKAQMESGLQSDIKNQTGSGATGLYQFIQGTWNSLLKKYPELGSKYGISPVSAGRDDRTDAYKSSVMYAFLRNDNMASLKGLTTGKEEVDIYLTHLLGSSVAKKFIKAYNVSPNSLVTSISEIGSGTNVYKQNLGVFSDKKKPRTLQQVVDYIANWNKSSLTSATKKVDEMESSQTASKDEEQNQPTQTAPIPRTTNSSIKAAVSMRQQVKKSTGPVSTSDIEYLNSALTSKVSMTEQRIKETAEASKAEKERNKPTPIVMNAPVQVQQSAPQRQVDYDPKASLSTSNNNTYLNLIKTQELSRLK